MSITVSLPPAAPPLDADPIKAIEHQQALYTKKEIRHGAVVRGTLTFALDFVLHLRSSAVAIDRFLAHAFWRKKPYKGKADRLPLLVMQFIYGVARSGGAKYERARKHSRIVEWYLSGGYTADSMRDDLRQKSLDDVEDQVNGKRNSGDVIALIDKECRHIRKNSVEDANLDLLDASLSLGDAGSSSANIEGQGNVQRLVSRYPFDTLREFAFEADIKNVEYLRQSPVGSYVSIRLERKPDNGQWAIFEAVEMRRVVGR